MESHCFVCVFIKTNWCGERRDVKLVTMGTTKFEVEKFMGSNDFGLWRLKMRALLVHQGLEEALKGIGGLPTDMSEPEKKTLIEKAHSAILLSLGTKCSEKFRRRRRQLVCGRSWKVFI